eukprot:358163-Chlamydomonas_euryale.AAC.3
MSTMLMPPPHNSRSHRLPPYRPAPLAATSLPFLFTLLPRLRRAPSLSNQGSSARGGCARLHPSLSEHPAAIPSLSPLLNKEALGGPYSSAQQTTPPPSLPPPPQAAGGCVQQGSRPEIKPSLPPPSPVPILADQGPRTRGAGAGLAAGVVAHGAASLHAAVVCGAPRLHAAGVRRRRGGRGCAAGDAHAGVEVWSGRGNLCASGGVRVWRLRGEGRHQGRPGCLSHSLLFQTRLAAERCLHLANSQGLSNMDAVGWWGSTSCPSDPHTLMRTTHRPTLQLPALPFHTPLSHFPFFRPFRAC